MIRVVLSTLAVALVACGPSVKPKTIAITEVGAPKGMPTTLAIGPAGGTISSPDGKVTLTVPANAVSTMTTFTVTPIETKSPGGLMSYRLGPDGTTFASNATITFKYAAADVAGSAPSLLAIVFQDGMGRWRRSATTVDETAKTVTTQTSHLSDWSMVRGAQLRPPQAFVAVKKSVSLSIQFCEFEQTAEDVQPLGYACNEYQDVTPIVSGTFVDGVRGGSAATGRVTSGATFGYFAPDNVPSPNPVSVSAELLGTSNGRMTKTLLVSQVTVLKENDPMPDPLPKAYTGSGTINSASGSGSGRLDYSASFQVAGGTLQAGSGEYTLTGTLNISNGVMGLPDCNCTITGGSAPAELGLGVDVMGKQQSVAVSSSVNVALNCTPTAMRTCPSSSTVIVTWGNQGMPACPGSTTLTFDDPMSLSGGFQRTCGTTSVNASWSLTGTQ